VRFSVVSELLLIENSPVFKFIFNILKCRKKGS